MSSFLPKIIITSGEPAGVGPDVCLHLLNANLPARISVLGDSVVFGQRAEQLGLQSALQKLNLLSVPTNLPVVAGRLEMQNVPMVLKQLDLAVHLCQGKKFHAMVTAPLHKGIINDAGHSFTGHTEYLAQKTQAEKPVMMLACEAMRVALVTTHMPLENVPKAINQENILRSLEILYNDLRLRFGIESPVIAVCGLNPHAGEQGHLGRTEIDIIEPSLEMARNSGYNILGPLPADTAFTPKILDEVDAVLTMYHDQGLPVLKYASFGKGTNITLGLPIIRTSVDHGTALDLAGTGRVDPGSMIAAVETAIEMAQVEYARKQAKRKRQKTLYAEAKNQVVKSLGLSPEPVSNNESTLSDIEFQDIFEQIGELDKPVEEQGAEEQDQPVKADINDVSNDFAVQQSKLEDTSETLIFREKVMHDMEMESTMTSTIDKTVNSMKNVLT